MDNLDSSVDEISHTNLLYLAWQLAWFWYVFIFFLSLRYDFAATDLFLFSRQIPSPRALHTNSKLHRQKLLNVQAKMFQMYIILQSIWLLDASDFNPIEIQVLQNDELKIGFMIISGSNIISSWISLEMVFEQNGKVFQLNYGIVIAQIFIWHLN